MDTFDLDFTINGKPATAFIDFADDPEQPIAAIRIKCENGVAVGEKACRNWLGDGFDSLVSHALSIRAEDITH